MEPLIITWSVPGTLSSSFQARAWFEYRTQVALDFENGNQGRQQYGRLFVKNFLFHIFFCHLGQQWEVRDSQNRFVQDPGRCKHQSNQCRQRHRSEAFFQVNFKHSEGPTTPMPFGIGLGSCKLRTTRSPWPSLWHVASTRGQSVLHDLPFV